MNRAARRAVAGHCRSCSHIPCVRARAEAAIAAVPRAYDPREWDAISALLERAQFQLDVVAERELRRRTPGGHADRVLAGLDDAPKRRRCRRRIRDYERLIERGDAVDEMERTTAALRHDTGAMTLARLLKTAGDVESAADVLRHALAVRAGDAEACFELATELAALGRTAEAARACPRRPRGAIAAEFDAFVDFDRHLRDTLQYRTPELVADVVARHIDGAPARLDVLDMGCGTGLCGPLLRPHARRLVGVDLSPGMLAHARARGVYDELAVAELTEHLAAHPDAYDLIAASDVLVYTGDLRDVFRVAARALRPGGLLVVSVERDDTAEYRLREHGRYAHSARHLEHAAAAAGLERVEPPVACRLRLERGAWVPGYVWAGRQPR